jgi:hypothetical protein
MGKTLFVCEICKKEFLEYKSNRVKKHIYCSKKCSDKSRVGFIPWNKGLGEYMKGDKNHFFGKTHTIKTRKKISQAHKGKSSWNLGVKQWEGKIAPRTGVKFSLESREKISKALKGKIPWNKNLSLPKSEADSMRILDKRERGRFRDIMQKQIFERDNYTCQLCGGKGDLQVDHIQSWKDYVELRFNINNCRTLCKECHYEITFGHPMKDKTMPWGHNLKKGGHYNFC